MRVKTNQVILSASRKQEIEGAAEQLAEIVTTKQYELWPGDQRSDFQLLDPDGACRVIGFKYLEQTGLTRQPFGLRGEKIATAGQVDLRSETITIAADLPDPIKRYTAMHEVGHVLMHQDKITMHRDIPLGGNNLAPKHRPLMEVEADYFSACYLMPRKLIYREFSKRFGPPPFQMSDQWALELDPTDPENLLRSNRGSLAREIALATAKVRGLQTLSKMFSVSPTPMAIRLRELKLIKWP